MADFGLSEKEPSDRDQDLSFILFVPQSEIDDRHVLAPYSLLFTPYRITLSARASTLGGIVRPICLAAFRLISNSDFVGCSTHVGELVIH